MTISTELRKAGPFTGNGVTTAFPFSFKVFAATDVTATRADTLGAETGLVLNTDFTVALNADQGAAPGGTVTLAAPLSTGYRLVVSSAVPNLQPTDITNNGGFYPRVIEDALDRHVAQIQQIDEKVGRALKVAITSPLGNQALPPPVAGMVIGWNESSDGLKNYAPIGGTLLGQQLAAANASSVAAAVLAAFPVGAVYITATNVNPGTFIGGTWARIGQGRTLIGEGTLGSDTYAAGATGGAARVTLTTSEMPAHNHSGATGITSTDHTHTGTTSGSGNHRHDFWRFTGNTSGGLAITSIDGNGSVRYSDLEPTGWAGDHSHSFTTSNPSATHTHPVSNEGGGAAHENRMPYLTVFFWQRTA